MAGWPPQHPEGHRVYWCWKFSERGPRVSVTSTSRVTDSKAGGGSGHLHLAPHLKGDTLSAGVTCAI